MEKMRMETPDITQQNIEKIGLLFPNCITEKTDGNGKLTKAINFEMLRQMLSGEVLEGDEAYEFTWVGKKAATVEANKPVRMTLRPCPEESVNWDTTENLYIEGDNLNVLKLLQESYLDKVKMIYIDPPYNTGKDSFAYTDLFEIEEEEYSESISRYDQDGNINFMVNSENGARFHSAWCTMIYPVLHLSRNLLKEDGTIWISIDNHEIDNLLKICDEVFGRSNRIACIANVNNPKGRSDEKNIATAHEYIIVYQKGQTVFSGFDAEENVTRRYNKTDNKGRKYRYIDLRKTGDSDRREDRPNMFYYFFYNENSGDFYPSDVEETPDGYIKIIPIKDDGSLGRWRVGLDTAIQRKQLLDPVYMSVKKRWTIMERDYLTDDNKIKATSAWTYKDVNSERGTEQFIALGFDKNIFPRPKPLGTIIRPIQLTTEEDDIILDFFSGSATTAEAVMRVNASQGGNRRFIMVQIPEPCPQDGDAIRARFYNICEIGKERIRRAGKKIKEESPLATQDLDIGFRVFKLDDTNMKDVYYSADEITQQNIFNMESNIKEDRTSLDLLFGCLLEWGLPLSLPYTSEQIDGCTVHTYNDGDVVACFDENIPDSVIKTIAKRRYHGSCALRAVFRDSSFADSPAKINVGEVFKLLSPDTRVKVI